MKHTTKQIKYIGCYEYLPNIAAKILARISAKIMTKTLPKITLCSRGTYGKGYPDV